MDSITKILIISSDENLKDVLNFCFDGWGYEVFLKDASKYNTLSDELEEIKKILPDVIVIDVQYASKEQLAICHMLKDNFATAFIPIITLINKRQLRVQLLGLKQGVDDYMIKPPDPLDLRIRIEMVIRRVQHSIHASSLTGLPGGRILEETLNERLKQSKAFSFGYIDIDNFKCFNDVYGYPKGDRVILQTAYMLSLAVRTFGNKDDFVSHIGGDDFAFITTSNRYEKICHNFIRMFDDLIVFHYSIEDRKRGFITTEDRTRKTKNIPLMSVSIAIVNRDAPAHFKNTIEINERIVEIKRYIKTISDSKFMVDRRDSEFRSGQNPQVYKKRPNSDTYKPLGQLLLEKGLINYEQLDEALTVHWKKGVLLGEVLKELGFINEEALQKVLAVQKENLSYPVYQN